LGQVIQRGTACNAAPDNNSFGLGFHGSSFGQI
jgi:hypothetical protein